MTILTRDVSFPGARYMLLLWCFFFVCVCGYVYFLILFFVFKLLVTALKMGCTPVARQHLPSPLNLSRSRVFLSICCHGFFVLFVLVCFCIILFMFC